MAARRQQAGSGRALAPGRRGASRRRGARFRGRDRRTPRARDGASSSRSSRTATREGAAGRALPACGAALRHARADARLRLCRRDRETLAATGGPRPALEPRPAAIGRLPPRLPEPGARGDCGFREAVDRGRDRAPPHLRAEAAASDGRAATATSATSSIGGIRRFRAADLARDFDSLLELTGAGRHLHARRVRRSSRPCRGSSPGRRGGGAARQASLTLHSTLIHPEGTGDCMYLSAPAVAEPGRGRQRAVRPVHARPGIRASARPGGVGAAHGPELGTRSARPTSGWRYRESMLAPRAGAEPEVAGDLEARLPDPLHCPMPRRLPCFVRIHAGVREARGDLLDAARKGSGPAMQPRSNGAPASRRPSAPSRTGWPVLGRRRLPPRRRASPMVRKPWEFRTSIARSGAERS